MEKIIKFFMSVKIEYAVAGTFSIAMVLIMTMNVFLRYVAHFSFGWSGEIVRYLCIFAAFFAISAGMRYGTHIGITVVVDYVVPKKLQKYFRLFAEIVTLAFCLTIIYYGFQFVGFSKEMGHESPAMQLPMYLIYSAIPIGMILSTIQQIIKIFYIKNWSLDQSKYDPRDPELGVGFGKGKDGA